MKPRQIIILAVSLAISAIFLFIAFRDLDPARIGELLWSSDWRWIVLGLLVYQVAMGFISWRWKFLVKNFTDKPITTDNLYPIVAVGYMGNNLYPFRAGEVLRLVLLRRGWGVPLARGAITVLVERCFDGLVMLTFILLPALLVEMNGDLLRRVAGVAAPLFIGAMVVFLVLAQRPETFRKLVHSITARLPGALGGKLAGIADEVINGLSALRSPRDLFGTVFMSYMSWMFEAGTYWLVAQAIGLPASYLLLLMVVGAVNLGGLIPASPGGVGVYEFLASSVLISGGIPAEQAVAYTLLIHVVIWVPPTVIGFILLFRGGLTVSRAREMAEET